MKEYKFYKPVSANTVEIPCFIETVYDSINQYVSFQPLLNDHYGSYREAVIHVPAEFDPELVGEGYLSLVYYADDNTRYYLSEPAGRVAYIPSKNYALIVITKEVYTHRNGSTFEKMYLRCNIDIK